MRFEIPACNLEWLNNKLEKLNRRAKRLKLPRVEFKVIDWSQKKRSGDMESFYTIEAVNMELKLDGGWKLICAIDHLQEGNLLRSIPGYDAIQYAKAPASCDHCKKTRSRKVTYIVESTETDQPNRQVGSDCLMDFLGHTPSQLALMADYIDLIELRESSQGENSHCEMFYLERFMEYAAQVALEHGFVSRAKANGRTTTADQAMNEYDLEVFPIRDKSGNRIQPIEIEQDGKNLAIQATEWVESQNPSNDFLNNLKVIFDGKMVDRKKIGYAAAAIVCYLKEVDRLKILNKEKLSWIEKCEQSKHFGTAKVRELYTLKLESSKRIQIDSEFQDSINLFTFLDEAGNVAIWFTGNDPGFVEGETYQIKATVKRHDEYNGLKQTILTRCKVHE